MRIVFIILGLASVALAIVGVFLPLLPTTPFLLLGAFFFARSSERLHDWLVHHPYFAQPIQAWQENGSISRNTKIYAMGVIVLSILFSLVLKVSMTILAAQILILSLVSLFILTRPEKG